MNQDQPEQEPGTGLPPMPVPPKFLDKLISEMEREEPLTSPPEAEIKPRVTLTPPPLARSVDDEARPRKNTLLVVALLAALAINLALVVMMFTVLRDRPAGRPESAFSVESDGVASPAIDVSSADFPQEAVRDAEASDLSPDAGPALPGDAAAYAPPAVALPLAISKVIFCREIRGYADYDPIPGGPLLPHHVPQIQTYIEMVHPKPEPRNDGRYIYYLTVALRLYPSGDPFAEPLIDKAVSLVVNGTSPREDFHAAQPLQINRRVGPGEYTLLVRVTDQISGETAREETRFRVQTGQL